MVRKLTQQEFEENIKQLHGEKLTILGQYNGRREYISVRHNCDLCDNHEWNVLAGNLFKQEIPCPKCHDINRRKGTEAFKKEVEETTNGEYLFIDEYKNNKTLSKFYHTTCGREFMMRPNEFVTGQRCPSCESIKRGLNTRTSHEEFLEQCKLLPNFNEYKILGTYERSDIKIEIYHKICKKSFWITPNNFLSGVNCSHCYKKINKTTEGVKKEIYEKTDGEYSLIGKYVNSKTNTLIRHNKCGHEWWTKASYIIEGHGCEKCRSSKGEKRITKWLMDINIAYKSQQTFKGLIGGGGGRLKFDFAILDEYKEPIFLIEYDGEAHFFPVGFGGNSEKSFYKNVYHDALKNAYCEDNNIPLLRIPYWEKDNIEQILTEELAKYNLIDNKQSQSA